METEEEKIFPECGENLPRMRERHVQRSWGRKDGQLVRVPKARERMRGGQKAGEGSGGAMGYVLVGVFSNLVLIPRTAVRKLLKDFKKSDRIDHPASISPSLGSNNGILLRIINDSILTCNSFGFSVWTGRGR